MPETGKKVFKILGWIALSLLVALIAAAAVIWFAAPAHLRRNVEEFVSAESGGLYVISYESVKLTPIPFSLEIKSLSLKPDKKMAQQVRKKSPDKVLYSFHSPGIKFQHIDLGKLFRKKIFKSEKLLVVNPMLKLSGDKILDNDSLKNMQNIFHELRPVFKNYLRAVYIEKIEFGDARYALSQTTKDSLRISQANKISVDVFNFRTDSAMVFGGKHLFKTDDVLIRMNNFHNTMGDSLHLLTIDTLEYSLKTTDIRAAGFRMQAMHENVNKNMYEVVVPHVYMKSKSITNFSFSDSLDIEFLEFHQPRIRFYQKENPKKLKIEDLNQFDLYTLVQNDFNKIEIDTFFLTGAEMEIYRQPGIQQYQHRFKSVNITLHGFLLDSASVRDKNKLLHASELDMSVADYHLRLEDNQHDFRADSLFVSTISQTLGAHKVRVLPAHPAGIDSRTVVNITGDAIEFEEVDLKKLYHTRTLPTSKIEIINPEVTLQYRTDIEKSEKQKEAGLLFDMVSAYLKGVYSNLVIIENGILNIENRNKNQLQGYFDSRFSFSLTDFTLDSASVERTDKFFYATNFDLRFSNYQMKLVDDLHRLDVDSIFISSTDRRVQVNNLHLQPVHRNVDAGVMKRYNRSELYNIFVPQIDLQGINLREAFFYNQLKISNFRISNPEIYFENFGVLRASREKKEFSEFYQLISSYIYDFDIKSIIIPNGEIKWINHTRKGKTTSFDNEFSAELENFRLNENELNKKRLLFSDNFNISIKDQLFQLSDSVHFLKAGEIHLSTANSSIRIKDALLYPAIASDNYRDLPTTFQISIPELKIRNFDFLSAYYTRNLYLEELDINHPKFQIYSKPGTFKSLDLKKYRFPLPAFLQSLQLDRFRINDGQVITYETKGINQRAVSNFNVDLSLPGLHIKNNENRHAEIGSDNFKLIVTNFKSPLGKAHNISVAAIDFNRSQKNLLVKGLQVRPFLPKNRGNQFSIDAPEISFTGFDINRAFENNDFIFENIAIQAPAIQIEMNDSINGDKVDFLQTLDLYPYTEPFVDRIQVKNLNLKNADINFNWFRKQLIDREINLVFKNILIAENQPPSNLLNSSEFEISTNNLRTTDKKGIYEFTADSFIYNSSQHTILFKNLDVKPLLSSEEIPRIKGFQTDVVNASVGFIQLSGINEKRWLKDNILDADLLRIGKARASIYRNKRYPFNHNQRPPWPQQLIREINQPFVFDSVILEPSYLKYSELLTISEEPGFIEFYDLQFKAGQISNSKRIKQENDFFTLNATTKLFNQAKLSATFNFDLTDKNYYHTVTGSLEQMPVTALNAMIEKSVPVSVESGNLNRFEFDMELNEERAVGELWFGYDDFRITLLDYSNEEVRKSKLATFWANKVILNSENPKGDELQPQTIFYERDEERSIINFWWKSIYSGAQKVIGIEPDK